MAAAPKVAVKMEERRGSAADGALPVSSSSSSSSPYSSSPSPATPPLLLSAGSSSSSPASSSSSTAAALRSSLAPSTTLGGVARKTFTPKLPTAQRGKRAPSSTVDAAAASSSLASRSSAQGALPLKSESASRRSSGFERPPDRVSFTAASRAELANARAVRQVKEEQRTPAASSAPMDVAGGDGQGGAVTVTGDERSSGSDAKGGSADSDSDSDPASVLDDEDRRSDAANRYRPIAIPFHEEGEDGRQSHDLPTAASSPPPRPPPYSRPRSPRRSTASVVTEAGREELLFFQLPSHLPLHAGLLPQSSSALFSASSSARAPLFPQRASSDASAAAAAPLDAKSDVGAQSLSLSSASFGSKSALQRRLLTFHPSFDNSLRWVPGGQVGRLLVLRSGRVKLEVGGLRLDVDHGMESGYHQQLVSVHAQQPSAAPQQHEAAEDEKKGAEVPAAAAAMDPASAAADGRREWIDLGDVRHRLVCTLDVHDVLDKFERTQRLAGGGAADGQDAPQHTRMKQEQP